MKRDANQFDMFLTHNMQFILTFISSWVKVHILSHSIELVLKFYYPRILNE